MPRHTQTRFHAHLLMFHPLGAVQIIAQHISPVIPNVDDLSWKDQSTSRVDSTSTPLVFTRIQHRNWQPRQIHPWPTNRIDTVTNTEPVEKAHAHGELCKRLRKRDYIFLEQRQARALNRHEGDLHVLQGQQHRLRQRERCIQLRQPVDTREPVHWIHYVAERTLRHHRALVSAAPHLRFYIQGTRTTHTAITLRHV